MNNSSNNLVNKAALFSSQAIDAIYSLQHPVQQNAVSISINDHHLPGTGENSSEPCCPNLHSHNVLYLLEQWMITEGSPSFGALLGEYGMGKTTTCMLFTKLLLEEYKINLSLPLPIYLDLRNINDKNHCHTLSLIDLLDEILKNSVYESPQSITQGNELIWLVHHEKVVIIFDGLDEILINLSSAAGQQFTHTLLSIIPSDTPSSSKVLLSCRTHYFRTGAEQKTYFMEKGNAFILLPFSSDQITEYLLRELPDFDKYTLLDLIQSVHNLSEFAERPYTLSLIPDLIPYIEQWKIEGSQVTGATIYRHMILSCLERDAGRHQLTIDHKQLLMEHFSAALWQSGKYIWNIQEIEKWFLHSLDLRPEIKAHYTLGKEKESITHAIEMLQGDLRTATFLVRVGHDGFRFAHTSLQEFFLASYLYRGLVENRIELWNLSLTSQETLDFLGQLLSESSDDERAAALDSLSIIRDTYQPQISELGFAYMLLAFQKDYPTPTLENVQLEGANLAEWNIEGKGDTHYELLNLSGASFQKANMKGSTLKYLILKESNFSDTQLDDTEFTFCQARNAIFTKAKLSSSLFTDSELKQANFSEAELNRSEWIRCNLEESIGLGSSLLSSSATFELCQPSSLFNYTHRQYALGLDKNVHQAFITTCKFSPDGKHLASVSRDHTLRIWNIATGKCLKLFQHSAWLLDCAFSSDGNSIVVAGADNHIYIWNIYTEECVRLLDAHLKEVRCCAFSPNNRYIASASSDCTIRLWDSKTGECLKILPDHQAPIRSCVFSPTGAYLASASDDKTLKIWDVNSGECLKTLKGHTDWVRKCLFTLDGSQLISASADKTLRIWDTVSGECLQILKGHSSRIRSCALSPDGITLASAAYDHTLRIWNLPTGKCLKILTGHASKIRGCDFSKNGLLASASDDLTMKLWDIQAGESIATIG
ncbi:MAG: pentapeptide repeat-containing protein [Pseudomonadota bacterium]